MSFRYLPSVTVARSCSKSTLASSLQPPAFNTFVVIESALVRFNPFNSSTPDFFRLRRETPQKIRLRRGLLSFFEQLSFEIPGSRTAGGRMLLNEKPNASALTSGYLFPGKPLLGDE